MDPWPLALTITNLIGILVNTYTLVISESRKFFCVIDKIPLGNSMPSWVVGTFAHSISLTEYWLYGTGYSFYILFTWMFMIFLMGSWHYRSTKELCKECIISYIAAFSACIFAGHQLDYLPWYIVVIYACLYVCLATTRSYAANN